MPGSSASGSGRLQGLPADQQAVIALLVRQGRTYAQVASLLAIEQDAVRGRAQDALAGLAGGDAPDELSDDEAMAIGDYVLGQQDESERIQTLSLLLDSSPGRDWGRGLAEQLQPLTTAALPQIPPESDGPPAAAQEPDDEPAAAPPRRRARPAPAAPPSRPERPARAEQPARAERPARAPRPARSPPSRPEPVAIPVAPEIPTEEVAAAETNRTGLSVLAATLALVIAAVVVFVVGSGASSTAPRGPLPASIATATAASASTTAAASTTGTTGTSVIASVTMKPAASGSSAKGAVAVIQAGTTKELAFEASGLPSPGTGHYVLWLYNSATQFTAVGLVPTIKNGKAGPFETALPSTAASYRGVLLTLETTSTPTKPGSAVLLGTSSTAL